MGNLKPGAKYIYESPDGGKTIYAREMGDAVSQRILVGQEFPTIQEKLKEDQLWENIRELAKTNETLKSELERVITVYHLVKEHTNNSIDHHSV